MIRDAERQPARDFVLIETRPILDPGGIDNMNGVGIAAESPCAGRYIVGDDPITAFGAPLLDRLFDDLFGFGSEADNQRCALCVGAAERGQNIWVSASSRTGVPPFLWPGPFFLIFCVAAFLIFQSATAAAQTTMSAGNAA